MTELGKFKVRTLELGHFRLDGGAMFGVVPRVMWERQHPADEFNRIDMVMRVMLIEVDDRKILVDTGFGKGRAPKFREMYSFDGTDDHLNEALATVGLTDNDITDIIITHLHFDHNGGSTVNKGGKPVPAFPNATWHIQKRQLEHARSRLEKDRASYLPEDFEPLIEHGVVNIVDGVWSLLPGIDVVVCEGHTPAQQLVRVQGGGKTILYTADLLPLASQIALPWIMAYDLYPVTTLQEKKDILVTAAEQGWILYFEHDPLVVHSQIVKTERGFALVK